MNKANITFSRKTIYSWYCYLLIGIAFLSSGHVYSITKGNLCSYILIVVLSLLLLKKITGKATRLSYKSIIILVFIFVSFFIDMIMNILFDYNLFYSLRFFAVLIFSYVFTTEMSFDIFKDIYVKCMTVISAIALIGFGIGSLSGFYYNLPTITNVNGVSYYDAVIFFGMDDYSRGRNIGIFWEPGIFAIFISIAVLFLIFDKEKLNKLQLVVLMLTLFTTLSTTGYFLISLCLIAFVYMRKKRGVTKAILIILATVFAIFAIINISAVFNFLLSVFPRVFTKLIDNSASKTHRIDSIKYNLEIFLQSPLWGSGLIRTNLLFSEMTKGSQTSTMTLYFAQFGLIGIIYVASHFIAVIKYRYWTKTMSILFCIAWAFLLNVEIVTFFPIIYIISFYFIEENLLK